MDEGLRAGVIAGFTAGALPSYAHYLTTRQSQLWHELAKSFHARASGEQAFNNIFEATAQMCGARKIDLIAIGAGGAEKESRLTQRLITNGVNLHLTLVDISEHLLLQAEETFKAQNLAKLKQSLVADIAATTDSLASLNPSPQPDSLRILTLFSVIPALASRSPLTAITKSLKPGDLLIFSVNLAPESDTSPSSDSSLAQLASFYDTPTARAWLQEILREVGLDPEAINWRVIANLNANKTSSKTANETSNDLCAFATVRTEITTSTPTEIKWGENQASLPTNHRVEIFRSHRHTSKSTAALVQQLGLELLDWQVSPSGEEGVALTRLPA